ncbi:response regulator [Marinactinospora thermotolerans]|uniref:Two component transcriptional regulator, LuxR family n=1 Tax=Marinactinospora thermotolerans DSM 45154 TaxID=1122192 RepID=A0A1T4PJU8_9ACTN|nr:response regulator transcription factor [Marinactinospora thermotolerans]SJZ91833.1 two component transcriptional regulator, LuxR family [Marinactinospora thermotolerans DSM 45154]
MSITVLLADDQRMVRTGFRYILQAQPDIEVVAEAADGGEALRLAQELRPDVSLLDIRMPGLSGLEVVRRLSGPGVADPLRVVMVTTFDIDEYVDDALENGASGFVLKSAGPALLVEAVRAAARGDALVSPAITVRLLERLARSRGPGSGGRRVASDTRGLTPRELDVVRAVAQGLTNAEIADRLYLSLGTVKRHLTNVQTKLRARNRVEIAAWAYRNGIVE